jgi:predicted RNase H-like HicB family nuclease
MLRIETLDVKGETATRKEKRPMKSYVFRVVVEEDTTASGQGAYHAYCPALKGCHTWGRTYDEALANVREAVELYIDDLREARRSRSILSAALSSGPHRQWRSTYDRSPAWHHRSRAAAGTPR